jgi:hypothetical protein
VVLRVRKADSAYLYRILESYEGITNFSTLPEGQGKPYRDVILHIPPDFIVEVAHLVERLKLEMPIEVIE